MRFGIIVGSHRHESNSAKVGRYLERRIAALGLKDEVYTLSLADNPLPLWDESMWSSSSPTKDLWQPYAKELQRCEAFIIISPEWSGMVPAGLKNFFLYAGNLELGHKPGLIVSVSSGTGGAYPVAELRMSSYKNTHLCYIPEHVIVRAANDVLNDDGKLATEGDGLVRKRLEYGLKVLREYGQALKQVRESGVLNYQDFPNGM